MGIDTVRMLVLETDAPHPETREEHGSFGEIFERLFTKAGESHDPPLGVAVDMRYVVDDAANGHRGSVPKASDIGSDVRAILITGSMYDAHGDDPWIQQLLELLRELWTTRADMRFAGVCFGHQLLARLLGAKVEPHPCGRWELSHTHLKLTDVGRRLFRTEDAKLSLHQMHQDQVTSVPTADTSGGLLSEGQEAHVWASTDHTEVQGLYVRDRLFTSQGHLGFTEDMVHRQIEQRRESGAIDEDDKTEVQEAQEKAHLEHDGELVAAAILRFFRGDDHDID